jgi:cytochrome c peroxidase
VRPPNATLILGGDPLNPGTFTPMAFTLYDAWQQIQVSHGNDAARQKVSRGQALFNSKQFTISAVNGLNLSAFDPLGANAVTGTCTTCHDSLKLGNHSLKLPIDIGVSDANPAGLDVSGLPVF